MMNWIDSQNILQEADSFELEQQLKYEAFTVTSCTSMLWKLLLILNLPAF